MPAPDKTTMNWMTLTTLTLYPLIPYPSQLQPADGHLVLGPQTTIVLSDARSADLRENAALLQEYVAASTALRLPVAERAASRPRRDFEQSPNLPRRDDLPQRTDLALVQRSVKQVRLVTAAHVILRKPLVPVRFPNLLSARNL